MKVFYNVKPQRALTGVFMEIAKLVDDEEPRIQSLQGLTQSYQL